MESEKKMELSNKMGHSIAFFLLVILIFAGWGFLREHPLTSGMSLLVFSLFYFISVLLTRQGRFIYSTVFLFIVGYYLLFLKIGITGVNYALISLPIVVGLLMIEFGLRKRNHSLIRYVGRCIDSFILFFTIFILVRLLTHPNVEILRNIIPLFMFSLINFYYFINMRKRYHQITFIILSSITYILIVFGIKGIPHPYYGIFFTIFSIGLMTLGHFLNKRMGIRRLTFLYLIGGFFSVVAVLFAVGDKSALLMTLFLISLHYFGLNRSIGQQDTTWKSRELILFKFTFGLANVAMVIAALLLFLYRFTPSIGVLIATLGYGSICIVLSHKREKTIIEARNLYVYIAGFFLTVFYLGLLAKLNPLGSSGTNMIFTIPLLTAVLYQGFRNARNDKNSVMAHSYNETAIAVAGICLFFPFMLGEVSAVIGFVLAFIFIICFYVFWKFSRDHSLLYFLSVIFSYLCFWILMITGLEKPMGFHFIPIGLAALGGAIFMQRKAHFLSRIFYLTWIIIVGLSLSTSQSGQLIWSISIWAFCFLIIPPLTQKRIQHAVN